ncbi:AAA family ATPase [Colwellia sp. MSW7]|uniref:AAA family ATPase n=1 Tax=Colwellia maritima TaxID=2912588 RepID=A0ABS9X812_9GAMM|nr:AAA family ATPase [Colwellia maritima]MCI2285927.1 AAA family ATPase [Colwellia maritima]
MKKNKALHDLDEIISLCDAYVQVSHHEANKPEHQKRFRHFSINEAAKLVGRDRSTIRKLELSGALPPPIRDSKNRPRYTIELINGMRKYFGINPSRNQDTDEPITLVNANFKGGCGKTTTTASLSHYLAIQGHKVLVVDMDSQASLTSFFGYMPDLDFSQESTVLPYFKGEKDDLKYAILKTHIDNVDIIPSCLELYHAEIGSVSHIAELDDQQDKVDFFYTLKYGLDTVKDDYDIILIDSPPSLGIISICVLLAADALLIPCAAKMPDFTSTAQFFRMFRDYIQLISPEKSYKFMKVVTSLYDTRDSSQAKMQEVQKGCFMDSLLKTPLFRSDEIGNSAADFRTPYDHDKLNKRVVDAMETTFSEIETEILKTWPSKHKELIEKGVIV